MNDGWFDRNGIRVGAVAALPGEQPQQQAELQIEQSVKDILRAVDDYGIRVMIEYQTKAGNLLPPKVIEPPIVFGKTADGDLNGLVTVFDSQDPKEPWKSFIVENILSVKDLEGNSIMNVQQVDQLSRGEPLTQDEEDSLKGKGFAPVEEEGREEVEESHGENIQPEEMAGEAGQL